jgi:hypothetical protein
LEFTRNVCQTGTPPGQVPKPLAGATARIAKFQKSRNKQKNKSVELNRIRSKSTCLNQFREFNSFHWEYWNGWFDWIGCIDWIDLHSIQTFPSISPMQPIQSVQYVSNILNESITFISFTKQIRYWGIYRMDWIAWVGCIDWVLNNKAYY